MYVFDRYSRPVFDRLSVQICALFAQNTQKGIEETMSKKQVATKSALSESTKRAIYIAVIIAIAAVIIAVSLALILKPAETVTADDSDVINIDPTDTVKDGTFQSWIKKNLDESYPRLASKWWTARSVSSVSDTTVSYSRNSGMASDYSSDSRDVEMYRVTGNTVYGVLDTDKDEWDTVKADLAKLGVTLPSNPGTHEGADEEDTNIYMIGAKDGTKGKVHIMNSSSFSVSSGSYVRISMWVNTKDFNGTAKVYVTDSFSLSLTKSSGLHLTQTLEAGKDEWQKIEFYVFNQNTSKSIKIGIGFGDTFSEDESDASGVLYVDNIVCESVSSNEYSIREDHANVKVFEATEKDSDATEVAVTDLEGSAISKSISYKDYLDEDAAKGEVDGTTSSYSPFVPRNGEDAALYKLVNNDATAPVGVRFPAISLAKSTDYDTLDCVHLSFGLRVMANRANTRANIVVEKLVDGTTDEWEKITSASATVEAVDDITGASANCGWKMYHIYLKPTDLVGKTDTVRVSVYLGETEVSADYPYNGVMYLTEVMQENVSSSVYSSASAGTDEVVKKAALTDSTSSLGVTNGSFSETDLYNNPTSWTPVFGGSNDIFLDGKANTIDSTKLPANAAIGTVYKDETHIDDSVKNSLKITTNDTAFGYLSSAMSLSANKVYLISVLAKVEGSAKPYIYLIDNAAGTERADMVIASIEDNASAKTIDAGKYFSEYTAEGEGWTRYYFVVVTGNTSRSVKLALMSGGILGDKTQTGTVCYDSATQAEIGSYSVALANEDDAEKTVTYTANSGYTAFDKLLSDETIGADFTANNLTNVKSVQPTAEQWKEIKKLDEKEDDSDHDHDHDDTNTTSDVDLGLLFSVLSSVLLVAALAVVIVIRIFKKKN